MIPAVKADRPEFVFIAEAYWDMEWTLQQQGFDYCYDKRLYDRLVHEGAEQVHGHLGADLEYQRRLVRFVENHDEPRAAATFPAAKARAAAVATLSQTGARLVHEGQLDGRTVRLPVFLGRRPEEPVDEDLRSFYERLLAFLGDGVFREGEWTRAERAGWDGNDTWRAAHRLGLARSLAQARRRQPRRSSQRRATSRFPGTTSSARRGSSTTPPTAGGTSGAARTSATVCMSSLPPWHWHLFDVTHIDSPKAIQP